MNKYLIAAVLSFLIGFNCKSQDSLSYRDRIIIDFTDEFNFRDRTSYLGPSYGITYSAPWRRKVRYGVGLNFLPHDDLFKVALGFNTLIKYYPIGFGRKVDSYIILSSFAAWRKAKNIKESTILVNSVVLQNAEYLSLMKYRIGLGYGLELNLFSRLFFSVSARINVDYGVYDWEYSGGPEETYFEDYYRPIIDATLSIGYKF